MLTAAKLCDRSCTEKVQIHSPSTRSYWYFYFLAVNPPETGVFCRGIYRLVIQTNLCFLKQVLCQHPYWDYSSRRAAVAFTSVVIVIVILHWNLSNAFWYYRWWLGKVALLIGLFRVFVLCFTVCAPQNVLYKSVQCSVNF